MPGGAATGERVYHICETFQVGQYLVHIDMFWEANQHAIQHKPEVHLAASAPMSLDEISLLPGSDLYLRGTKPLEPRSKRGSDAWGGNAQRYSPSPPIRLVISYESTPVQSVVWEQENGLIRNRQTICV